MKKVSILKFTIVLSLSLLLVLTFHFQERLTGNFKVVSTYYLSHEEKLNAPRGNFIDSKGRALSENLKVYDIYFSYYIQDSLDLLEAYSKEYSLEFATKPILNQKKLLFRNLTKENIAELQKLGLQHLEVKESSLRKYQFPKSFAHVLGYTGTADSSEPGSYEGKYKLEKQLDAYLRGSTGNVNSSEINKYFSNPVPGNNVFLTINSDWQNKLYELLEKYSDEQGAAGGAAVIIESNTGEVRAITSFPGIDLNRITLGIEEDELDILAKARGKPLLDKTISTSFTPGSIFKIITGYSLLDTNVINENTTVYSNSCLNIGNASICEFGRLFYGLLNVVSAYAKSSNIFFCTYSLEQESLLKNTKIPLAASLFGIGEKTGIDLEGEVAGNLDSPEYRKKVSNQKWFPGDTCNLSIGQGALVVTPMQMALVNSIIENNGEVVQPYIIKEIKTFDNLEVLSNTKIVKRHFEINQEAKRIIDEGLSAAAYSYESAISPFFVGLEGNNLKVKTGTAETLENLDGEFLDRTQGWIIGRFDYEGKNYSFAFLIQYGQGGYYVAPMLRDFLNYINTNGK